MKLSSALAAAVILSPVLLAGVETQRFNLPDKPTKPRFEVTEKKWPANVGEADLCLWHDDRLAAVSLGVDDNFAGEIDWWKEQAQTYDLKVTWWVITGRVLSDGRSYGGLWSQFQELESLGHAVESHTVTHLHIDDLDWGKSEWNYAKARAAAAAAKAPAATGEVEASAVPSMTVGEAANPADRTPEIARGVEWEYAESIAQINANIPGKKASALAYPGGGNTKYNDRNLAAKYFRVARGATGAPNMANQIDYLSTNAMSGWDFVETARGGNVYNILDRNLYRGRYYRGWLILFAHGVGANTEHFTKTFEFIKANRENLWLGLYTDVAKYGQERDTATLKIESPGPEKISFLLTDEMDDTYFNFPLTVKVRIPEDWKAVEATQGGKAATATVVEHEGSRFALVHSVPDAGLVTLVGK